MILLTGSSGYVGGRLLSRLAKTGRKVRCLVRRPRSLAAPGGSCEEFIQGDAFDLESLRPAMAGVEKAYYLIHSMAFGPDFEDRDRQCASNFARAAAEAGAIQRIVNSEDPENPWSGRHDSNMRPLRNPQDSA